jgi:hypothetical protein
MAGIGFHNQHNQHNQTPTNNRLDDMFLVQKSVDPEIG